MKVIVTAPAFMESRLNVGDIIEVDEDFKASWAEEYSEPEEVEEVEESEGDGSDEESED